MVTLIRLPISFSSIREKNIHATLSVQLKTLVENGLVMRTQYEDIPPRVEYSLTEIGQKFQPVLIELQKWGPEYLDYMKEKANP